MQLSLVSWPLYTDKAAKNSIIKRVPQAFRRCFRQLVDKLSLNNLLRKPYSMNEAMPQAFFGHKFIGCRCPQRQWANQCTARIYVNTSLQNIGAHSITSEAESKISQACNLVHQEMAKRSRPTHRCSTLPPPGTDSIINDLKLFAEAFGNSLTSFLSTTCL